METAMTEKPEAKISDNDFPRRARLDKFCPAERAIWDAVGAVEAMPADLRLTDAVILLQAARDSVADFVDGVDQRRYVRLTPERAEATKAVLLSYLDALELDQHGMPADKVDGDDPCPECGRVHVTAKPDADAHGFCPHERVAEALAALAAEVERTRP
jgi:hypothetical protein